MYLFSMFPLLHNLKNTIVQIFSGWYLLFHVAACSLTYLIVSSGADWEYFKYIQSASFSQYIAPAIGIGMLLPLLGFVVLYTYAKLNHNTKLLHTTWCVAQAGMLGWVVSAVYKTFTGRVQPPRELLSPLYDLSHNWNFGFYEHGIFWGWPSSHTTVAFAMSFALITLYPKKRVLAVLATIYAVYIGIGVSTGIHWISESVAGALFGICVGIVVGKSFRKMSDSHS